MPKPESRESEKDFMSRCIPELVKEGKDQEQAVAACSAIFAESEKSYQVVDEAIRGKAKKPMDGKPAC